MAEKTTWIKIDRNIMQWRWYTDTNTKAVFLHLLLTANIEPHGFQLDTIKRGEVATSIGQIAKTLGITYAQARTALTHLKETKEITIKRRPKYLVISIMNYSRYQDGDTQNARKSQSNRNQIATIKEIKNERNIPTVYIPTRGELSSYVLEEGLAVDADEIFDYYEAVGWRVGNRPVRDWKALCRRWKTYERPKQKQSGADIQAEAMRLLEERDRKEGRINDEARSE